MNQNIVIRLIGVYAALQILAQDLGIPSSKRQESIVHHPVSQAILLYAGAYSLTENYNQATIVFLAYYALKYIN